MVLFSIIVEFWFKIFSIQLVCESKLFVELKLSTVVGGQETTAFVNACTIFMLAHHQDVQNKVGNFIMPMSHILWCIHRHLKHLLGFCRFLRKWNRYFRLATQIDSRLMKICKKWSTSNESSRKLCDCFLLCLFSEGVWKKICK